MTFCVNSFTPRSIVLWSCLVLTMPGISLAQPAFQAEELVQASGVDLDVIGYSVPSCVDWNEDGRPDLIVGEGSGASVPKVRVYLNSGTRAEPVFTTWFYAQSLGVDLTVPGSGCLGIFPRVVQWDDDGRKDLLVGTALGNIRLYLNTNTNADPQFDGGQNLQVGMPGFKTDITVGARATCSMVDWNNDGKKDLVAGAMDGLVHVFMNDGEHFAPDFSVESFAMTGALSLYVPGGRSSPVVMDLDEDGKKDILAGNTNGEIVFFSNAGTDAAPRFSTYTYVEAAEVVIDLEGSARSRPFIADWDADGAPDLLVGGADGLVHLFRSPPVTCAEDLVAPIGVEQQDLNAVLNRWGDLDCLPGGSAFPCLEDLAEPDGVEMQDLNAVLNRWGDPACAPGR